MAILKCHFLSNLTLLDGITSKKNIYVKKIGYFCLLGPVYDSVWSGPYKQSRPIQQTSALDLLLAAVPPGVRCNKNPHCRYGRKDFLGRF